MDTLDDQLLAHQISTIKHGAELGQSVVPYLSEMKAIIRKRVAGFDAEKRTARRLEAMIEKLAKELNIPADEWRKQLEKQLKEFAKYEATYQADTIESWVKVDMVTPTLEQVWAAAKFDPLDLGQGPISLIKMMDDWPIDEVARMTMGVKAGFIQGLSVRQIIKDVVGAGGLADVSQRNAEAVAQTALAHVASTTRMEVYKENDDVVIGWTILASLDNKTSDICRHYDHVVVLFTDAKKPKPIFHWRCRTTTTPKLGPEFDIFAQGAERASKGAGGGEPVSAATDYYMWLKRQPAAFQDDVLGQTKGLVFRNAGLSAEEFRKLTVNDLGQPLTLKEMAAADRRVAEYLNKQ